MAVETNIPSDAEREIAAAVAHKAMVSGWERAIQDVGAAEGLKGLVIENILNKVSKESRDPSSRIDELQDWETHKMRRSSNRPSDRVRGTNLHKLSPGLRAYMEKKLKRA